MQAEIFKFAKSVQNEVRGKADEVHKKDKMNDKLLNACLVHNTCKEYPVDW